MRLLLAGLVLATLTGCDCRGGAVAAPSVQFQGSNVLPNGDFEVPCSATIGDEIGTIHAEAGNPGNPSIDYTVSASSFVDVSVDSFSGTEIVFKLTVEDLAFTSETLQLGIEYSDGTTFDFQVVVRNACPPDEPDDPDDPDDPGDECATITSLDVPPLLRDPRSLVASSIGGQGMVAAGGVMDPFVSVLAQNQDGEERVVFWPPEEVVAHFVRRTADRTQAIMQSNDRRLTCEEIGEKTFVQAKDLFHVDLETGDVRRLTYLRDEDQGRGVADYVWARDGTKVLLSVYYPEAILTTGPDYTLHFLDLATLALTEVPTGPLPQFYGMGLSPDSSKIVFAADGKLVVHDVGTGTNTPIVVNGSPEYPNWHPTEDRIVYVARGSRLFETDSTGAQVTELPWPGGDLLMWPDWSPSGDHVAMVGDPTNDREIVILEVATGTISIVPDTEFTFYLDW